MTVNKTADVSSVTVGGTVNYTVVVVNNGNVTLDNVVLSDTLFGAATNVAVNGTAATLNADGTLTVPALSVGGTATVTYTATAPTAAGTLTNTATATGTYANTDGTTGTTTGTATYNVGVTAAPGTPGGTITPAGTTPAATPAATPLAGIVTPLATALQNAYQTAIGEDATPLAAPSEQISDDGTPLATLNVVCWVHWYIMLGMLVTLVYGIVCLARRRRYTKSLEKRDRDVCGEEEEEPQKGTAFTNVNPGEEA
ncbi:MAG: hypothetical protein LKE37_07460 [Atopobiaceae bacterium]|nr:hypothetical protein [Atopobiaceae bacterium]